MFALAGSFADPNYASAERPGSFRARCWRYDSRLCSAGVSPAVRRASRPPTWVQTYRFELEDYSEYPQDCLTVSFRRVIKLTLGGQNNRTGGLMTPTP